jgi:translation initiation factor 2 beta subunit (eIF-2beta)/eIF-5
MEQLGDVLGYREHMSWFLLQEFDTELDFSNKVRLVRMQKFIGT